MRKRRIFLIIAVGVISVVLMGLDVYENKKRDAALKAEAEKIYTVSDIMKDANFSDENATLYIGAVVATLQEPFNTIKVENPVQKKRIIDELNNLQLKQIKGFTSLEKTAYLIDIKLNKNYTLYVFENEKQIRFLDFDDSTGSESEYLYYYTILNGDDFFNALKNLTQT
ncbi:hypothetical protein [Lysinibacillus sp. JNUCC-52]|uniref:hypothetical protein n=1 Tax=Lysinibacillus sp. JNUCC-52 TaxID=2792480 RepID=UPI001937AA09|nr:hypothetical protein JNUCC52_07490 [Lysinibacillus sp. JNUCC-52]